MNHTFEITHPVPGKHGVLCPSCGQTRHPKLFRYPITLAQAEARGYFNHEERPMHATSKLCSYCRAHVKRGKEGLRKAGPNHVRPSDLRKLRRDQLQIELTRGRVKPQLVEMELKRRDDAREQNLREARRLGGQRRWEKHDDKRWAWVHGLLNKELQHTRNKIPLTRLAVQDGQDPTAGDRLTFFQGYVKVLAAARDRARVGLGDAKDGEYTWTDLTGVEDMAEIRALWQAIDHKAARKRPGRPPHVPVLLLRRDKDLFEGCPVQPRTERVKTIKTGPFKPYVYQHPTDNSWDT